MRKMLKLTAALMAALLSLALLFSCQSTAADEEDNNQYMAITVNGGGDITWQEMGPGGIELTRVESGNGSTATYIFKGTTPGHVTLSFLRGGERIHAYSVTVADDLSITYI